MSQWFYAVARGRQVGVYTSWPECHKQVDKILNAKYKKFKTQEEAVEFIRECTEKYSPAKGPSQNSSPSLPSVAPSCLFPCTQPERPSSVHSQQFSVNLTQPRTVAQNPSRNEDKDAVLVRRQLDSNESTNSERLPLLTSSTRESVIEEDPFLSQRPMTNPANTSSFMSPNNNNNINNEVLRIRELLERFENNFSDVKNTLDQMLLKINDLDIKVQQLCQNEERRQNQSASTSGFSGKRALFEGYDVPQPVGNRSFSTISPVNDVEVVPIPPKKIPKIEVNSDDEIDGFRHDFKVDENGYVIVYTDGACENNGRKGAKAGIGVWFGDSHPLNCSEPVHGRPTNNTAEIQAAVQAVETAKRAGVKKIIVHTDSEFMINCITKWIKKWVKNDWKVASGSNVKNKDDLLLLMDAMKGIDVKWEHVRGHMGIHGNEMADHLARSGAQRYKT